MAFHRRWRHFERYVEIGRILTKHGWESLLGRTGLAELFQVHGFGKGATPEPVQVRETLEELGPTFIKLGQVLSTRFDLLPHEYLVELEKLQDEAPRVPIEEINLLVEEEFGVPPTGLFASFENEPLAAASLGQTHMAVLNNGTPVVVKVQRPGIRPMIETDLEIVLSVARFLDRHLDKARAYALPELADEFSITLRNELDYTREGRNGDLFCENLADIDYARAARTVWEYSTARVLTLERLCGVKITDLQGIAEHGYSRPEIARNLWRVFLKMIFVDAFFHADPHPGNLVVLDGNVIGLIDYGMVGRLDREVKNGATMLLAEYVHQDSRRFVDAILSIGTAPPDLNKRTFITEMDRLLRQFYGAPLREIKMGDLLSRAFGISARYGVRLPPSLGLLVKVILGIEGIDRLLDPDYNLSSEAEPFIRRAMMKELSFASIKSDISDSLIYWKSLLYALPNRTSQVLDKLAEGTFRVVFRHEGLEEPTRNLDRAANRLSLAAISSASIIASALIISAKVGPMWKEYPLLGLAGFVVSFFFAFWLMISIIRAGRLW